MFLLFSTLVLIVIAVGLYYRQTNKKLHIMLMASAFLIDLTLVLVIEIQRHAVEVVVSQTSAFVWFHALVSTMVLVLYIVLAVLGSKMAKMSTGTALINATSSHAAAAKIFIALRLTNYITSFWMVS